MLVHNNFNKIKKTDYLVLLYQSLNLYGYQTQRIIQFDVINKSRIDIILPGIYFALHVAINSWTINSAF